MFLFPTHSMSWILFGVHINVSVISCDASLWLLKKYLEHVGIQLIVQIFHLIICAQCVYWAHWDQGFLFSILWHQIFGESFPKTWQNWSNLHEKKENFQNFPKCFQINDKICWGKRKHWLELVSSFFILWCYWSGNHP